VLPRRRLVPTSSPRRRATALFAATIAVAQNDIKKVLAYSTVSQLGYMFLAVGSGAYVAAIFHMITHAFFKALLFLGPARSSTACTTSRTCAAWARCASSCRSPRHVHRRLARHRRRAAVLRLLVEGRDPAHAYDSRRSSGSSVSSPPSSPPTT
jgi:hypothetical protein